MRRLTGTEVAAPLLPVNCTDSDLSSGVVPSVIATGTAALECAGIVTDFVLGPVSWCCPNARTEMVPRYLPGFGGGSCRWLRPLFQTIFAVHLPAMGRWTVTCSLFDTGPFAPLE